MFIGVLPTLSLTAIKKKNTLPNLDHKCCLPNLAFTETIKKKISLIHIKFN